MPSPAAAQRSATRQASCTSGRNSWTSSAWVRIPVTAIVAEPTSAGTRSLPAAVSAPCSSTSGFSPSCSTRKSFTISGAAPSVSTIIELLDCSPRRGRLRIGLPSGSGEAGRTRWEARLSEGPAAPSPEIRVASSAARPSASRTASSTRSGPPGTASTPTSEPSSRPPVGASGCRSTSGTWYRASCARPSAGASATETAARTTT